MASYHPDLSLHTLLTNQLACAVWRLPSNEPEGQAISILTGIWSAVALPDFDLANQATGYLLSGFTSGNCQPIAYILEPNGPAVTLAQGITNTKPASASFSIIDSTHGIQLGLLPEPNQDAAQHYQLLVSAAIEAIREGQFSKLVCSHAICYEVTNADGTALTETLAMVVEMLYGQLLALYPTAFVSMVQHPDFGLWLTASPELLLSEGRGVNRHFATVALAGTRPASIPNNQPWGNKEVAEQAHVTNYIAKSLADIITNPLIIDGPHTEEAGPVTHLRSDISWTVSDENKVTTGRILAALHPTSATCGSPKVQAIDFLIHHEGYDRQLYAGFGGPISPDNLQVFVNLRTVQISGNLIKLYVGAGVIASSDPIAEWNETLNKALTMLRPLHQVFSNAGFKLSLLTS